MEKRSVYIFIRDENKKFMRAKLTQDGGYSVSRSSSAYPIYHNPKNLVETEVEFGTNYKYLSLNRVVSYPLQFIKDGAAILRELYHLGKGKDTKAYLSIIEINYNTGKYELSYEGRLDFSQKEEDPKSGIFECPSVDESAWGLISQNENVVYSIDCSSSNSKSVRVLYDGITLLNRYIYQTVQYPIIPYDNSRINHILPFVLINQDGDSSGIVSKSQQYENFDDLANYVKESKSNFFYTHYQLSDVNISGTIEFKITLPDYGTSYNQPGRTLILFRSSLGFTHIVFDTRYEDGGIVKIRPLIENKVYKVDFNFDIDLSAGESIFFVGQFATVATTGGRQPFSFTPIVTNIYVKTKSIQQPAIAYGLRGIDVIKEIVRLCTNGLYSIDSTFLTENNNDIVLSGDSIRGVENPRIYTSFSSFFESFSSIYFLALKNISGKLRIEKFTDVYKNDISNFLIDLGECIDFKLKPANEFFFNEILVGSPNVDLRHPSGRYEFNSEATYSLSSLSSDKKLEMLSKYRLGCYEQQFLIMDYRGDISKDNDGDKNVYLAKIINELGVSKEDISNFEIVTINNTPLAPIITYPTNEYLVTYNKPFIKGVAKPLENINIYVDSVLDGNTTADSNGNWQYNIDTELSSFEEGVETGVHLIQATYTDLSASFTSLSLTIDTSISSSSVISYPNNGDYLFNNKPVIKGAAQALQNIDISINDVYIGSTVANGSCMWEFQSPLLSNGNVKISINSNEDISNIVVDNNVSCPIITYIAKDIDINIISNNRPLIKGIATPGEKVDIYLNYIKYEKLNKGIDVIADSNGNWEFQTVDVSYIDHLSGYPIILVPIQNGVNTISTSLSVKTTSIGKTGYKLSRPSYSSITGVVDNTVFNTEYSPSRMIEAHYPLISSVMSKRPLDTINFETHKKNGNLRTVLNGKEYQENDDILTSSLGSPIAILEYAHIKVKAYKTFIKALYDFNTGFIIKSRFRGNDIYMLPIGTMKMSSILSDVQEWKLLLSSVNSYQTLLNLYKNGLTINLMKNSIYHSDANFLHFVQYNFSQPAKYNSKNIYQDWFSNRNDAWSTNPLYTQKCQTSEVIRDQVVSNGISNLILRMYRCSDAKLIDTIMYEPVSPAPIPPPDIVLEAVIDFSQYPEDKYFFVQCLSVASESGIIISNQDLPDSNTYLAGFSGNPSVGDKAVFDFKISSQEENIHIELEYTSDYEDLEEFLDDLKNLIDSEELLTCELSDYLGDAGIRVETAFGTDSISGYGVIIGGNESILNIAISERVETKANWENSILIESYNSINSVGTFYSTGFKTIIRVEGLIKKLQPEISTIIASEENGNKELLYSKLIKKRVIRFGTGYGLPDYLYLKIANALTLDNLFIDGERYTLAEDEKIEPSEDVDGHPLYYYNVNLNLSENVSGAVFAGAEDANNESVVIVVDATAFGLPTGSLININIEKE